MLRCRLQSTTALWLPRLRASSEGRTIRTLRAGASGTPVVKNHDRATAAVPNTEEDEYYYEDEDFEESAGAGECGVGMEGARVTDESADLENLDHTGGTRLLHLPTPLDDAMHRITVPGLRKLNEMGPTDDVTVRAFSTAVVSATMSVTTSTTTRITALLPSHPAPLEQ